ncbi:MAG: hypothetical protein GY832_29770 [Chloroflexi bacterium]|nr:hypothetical protein [Chloroflexota bacterium]
MWLVLATAETEAGSLGLPRFLPVREPGNEPCVTDCREIYRPDLLIGPAAVPQSAPSPSSPGLAQVVHWFPLGRGTVGGG